MLKGRPRERERPFDLQAVGVGFEPTVTLATTVFKTVPLGRSGNPPRITPSG